MHVFLVDFLVRKLGDLTLALGKQIAPHIKEQGSRLLSSALNKDKAEANDTMDGVLTVAAGGLVGEISYDLMTLFFKKALFLLLSVILLFFWHF